MGREDEALAFARKMVDVWHDEIERGVLAWFRRVGPRRIERMAIGSDHAGFKLKQVLVGELQRRGRDVPLPAEGHLHLADAESPFPAQQGQVGIAGK